MGLVAKTQVEIRVLGLFSAAVCDYAIAHVRNGDFVLFALVNGNVMSVAHSVLVHGLEFLLLLNQVSIEILHVANSVQFERLL